MNKKKILIIVGLIIAIITALIIVLLINNKTVTYEIFFETSGGSLVESQTVSEGEQVKKPADPKRDGYMFVEWTYQEETYDFSSKVKSNLTLKARWIKEDKEKEKFIVKFETDGGTTISNQVVEKGNKVIKPVDPIKDNYVFNGWTLSDEIFDFEKIIEEDIVLKAKWKKVTNNNPTNNGSNNNGINNNGINNNGINNNNTTKPTTPTTPTVKKYTVTFNSNGGSAVSFQTITDGEKALKPSNPTRSGYTFEGWTLNGNAYDFNSVVKSNITLVAKWKENTKAKYTVTFNSNGGSTVSSQTVTEGNKVTRPKNPTKNGYNFDGWLLNGSIYDFNSSINDNITLIAKWVQKSYVVKVSEVDQYSTDVKLTIYEDGNIVSTSEIQYTDGTHLCSGDKLTVAKVDIAGITSLIVVLSDGTKVTAVLQ